MNILQNDTKNYLVPSSGQTHAVTFTGLFGVTPVNIDWRQFSIDNYPFQPQGVFIDNSQGTADLIINFQPINYNVVCPAGITGQFQFPSVDQQTSSIIGQGQASVVFVDFPVLPNSGITQIGNTVGVNIVGPNPLPVSLPVGSISVQGNVLNNAETAAYASSLIIKNLPGQLYKLNVFNSNAAAQFIQLHDSATLPANGVVPQTIFTIPGSSNLPIDLGIYGRNFLNGIVVCNSSTGPTKTIGAADCFFDAQYF